MSDRQTAYYHAMATLKVTTAYEAFNAGWDSRDGLLADGCAMPEGFIRSIKGGPDPEQPSSYKFVSLFEKHDGDGWYPLFSAQPNRNSSLAMYQGRVQRWATECFGEHVASNKMQRVYRFLEEAIELAQSLHCTREECIQLVDYVYGRQSGVGFQEVGGVMVTLAALCAAHSISLDDAAEGEIARVWSKIDVIRAKQAAKTSNDALPGGAGTPKRYFDPSEVRFLEGEPVAMQLLIDWSHVQEAEADAIGEHETTRVANRMALRRAELEVARDALLLGKGAPVGEINGLYEHRDNAQ